MKIVTLNVEFAEHVDKTIPFLEAEQADVLCLHEVTYHTENAIRALGYQTTFLPILKNDVGTETAECGSLFATRVAHESNTFYYHKPAREILKMDKSDKRNTVAQGCIVGNLQINGVSFVIATTHFTWTPAGNSLNDDQRADLPKMLNMLHEYGPHILCGDMNIPRRESPLYELFLQHYTDAIPEHFNSSLDKELHRLGNVPEKAVLFSNFMVDYLFTQPPYRAKNVRLEFGVSDHAAVIGEVEKND